MVDRNRRSEPAKPVVSSLSITGSWYYCFFILLIFLLTLPTVFFSPCLRLFTPPLVPSQKFLLSPCHEEQLLLLQSCTLDLERSYLHCGAQALESHRAHVFVLLLIPYPTIRQHPEEQDLAPGPVSGFHRGVCPPSSSTRFAVDRIATLYAPVKSHASFLCCGRKGLNPVSGCCGRLGWVFHFLNWRKNL